MDKTAVIYTTQHDGLLHVHAVLVGHKDGVTSAAFSPKEKNMMATSSLDRTGRCVVCVWVRACGVSVCLSACFRMKLSWIAPSG